MATINGKDIHDSLIGTDEADVIKAYGDNDYVVAGKGADQVYGMEGNDYLYGGEDNDTLDGGNGNDYMEGQSGWDTLYGGAGNDTLGGDAGSDGIFAGPGDDMIRGSADGDFIEGGDGYDTVDYSLYVPYGSAVSVDMTLSFGSGLATSSRGTDQLYDVENIIGTSSADLLIGQNLAHGLVNMLDGRGGSDKIFGMAGSDDLHGGDGGDTVNGGSEVDGLWGDAGNDVLDGGTGGDYIDGGADTDTVTYESSTLGVYANLFYNEAEDGTGHDQLYNLENLTGSQQGDKLYGNMVGNTLSGLGGSDLLQGHFGSDTLTGGNGTDTFQYWTTNDSGVGLGKRDVITDFAHGVDKIDLHTIDAQSSALGSQDFTFVGTAAFTAEGQVRVFSEGGNTIVEMNTAGTGGTESQIELTGLVTLAASDFVL